MPLLSAYKSNKLPNNRTNERQERIPHHEKKKSKNAKELPCVLPQSLLEHIQDPDYH